MVVDFVLKFVLNPLEVPLGGRFRPEINLNGGGFRPEINLSRFRPEIRPESTRGALWW